MSEPDPPSDEALLAAHVAGDPDAFGEIFRRHSDRLWAVALRTCRHPEDAADAVQDAMISAFRRAATFRGDAKVSTWLHRIVVNACLDRIRSQRARPTVPLPDDGGEYSTRPTRDHIDENVIRLTVEGALARLPEEQRLALTLVDLHGWSVDDAAQILNIPPGTVKSRCFRGRARLHDLLRNQDQPGGVPPDVLPGSSRQRGGS
jgi:RNA polymerase sigma-70 factor (ECF subfamily)